MTHQTSALAAIQPFRKPGVGMRGIASTLLLAGLGAPCALALTLDPATAFTGVTTAIGLSGAEVADGDTAIFLLAGDAECDGAASAADANGGVVVGSSVTVSLPSAGGYKLCRSGPSPRPRRSPRPIGEAARAQDLKAPPSFFA